MSKLYLILSIHNHQPVGNFDYVLENTYKNAYLPFLEKLFSHPGLKVVLHYSGNLLLWLERRHPEAIDMIRDLIKSGRAELLSGGFYEPILSALPENDRVMQVKEMSAYIKDKFDYTPRGIWLAERVWEPHMPKYISRADIAYLSVDDHHFKLAGLENKDLLGCYITEESGNQLKIFPGSEDLRYLIPFKGVADVMAYFKEVHMAGGSPLLTMADDGEKFGAWPETYKHCYDENWLDSFFSALEENSDWIETTTFKEYEQKFYPAGRIYLPAASYREMGEWSLPPESALDYGYALNEMQKLFGDRAKGLIRGGIWRSFFAKYAESNHIHKRMLLISRKAHGALDKPGIKNSVKRDLLQELWKGQCNDAYWHGIFGGLYLPHLRSSLYRHLLNAELIAEGIMTGGSPGTKENVFIEKGDIDCDGYEDICVSNKDLSAFLTAESGALIELSLKEKGVNVLDILTRRPEAYHSRISESVHQDSSGTKTIHDRFYVKEAGLLDYLIYDNYRRASLLDHFFDYNITLDELIRSEYEEKGDFIGSPYQLEQTNRKSLAGVRLSREGRASGCALKIDKSVIFKKSEIRVDYMLQGKYNGIFGIEFNLSFLGSPYASIHAGDRTCFIRDKGMSDNIKKVSVKDDFLGVKMVFAFDEAVGLWHYPVETISLSEQGVERIYQGTAFLFMHKVDFVKNKKIGLNIKFGE